MKRWIVMDLDGTLADSSHRFHLAQAKEWDLHTAAIAFDTPKQDAVEFLEAISALGRHAVLVLTGRDNRQADITFAWFHAFNLKQLIDVALFRPEGDKSKDADLKLRLLDEFFGSRQAALASVALVLDDKERVVQAYRDAGFKCWQVAVGEY